MEQEHFLTGYCRNIDQSRMVTAVTQDSQLTEIDCCYESCVHAPGCTVAKQIAEILQSE